MTKVRLWVVLALLGLLAGCAARTTSGEVHVERVSPAIKELRGLSLATMDELGRPSILAWSDDTLYATWSRSPGYEPGVRKPGATDTLFIGVAYHGGQWAHIGVLSVGQHQAARLYRSANALYVLLWPSMQVLRMNDDLSSRFVADIAFPSSDAGLAVDVAFQGPDTLGAAYNIVTQEPSGQAVQSLIFRQWAPGRATPRYEAIAQVPYVSSVVPTVSLTYLGGQPRIVANEPLQAGASTRKREVATQGIGLSTVVQYTRGQDGRWSPAPLTGAVQDNWRSVDASATREVAAILQSDRQIVCLSRAAGGAVQTGQLSTRTPMLVSTDPLFPRVHLATTRAGSPLATAAWLGLEDASQSSALLPRAPLPLASALDLEPTSDIFVAAVDLRTVRAGKVTSIAAGTPWGLRESAASFALSGLSDGSVMAIVTAEPRVDLRLRYRLRIYRITWPS
jgi:hypothetical protein